MHKGEHEEKRDAPMKNITINLPELYDENIQKLIDMKLIASRSEAVRTAIREFLYQEYKNMQLLNFGLENRELKNQLLIQEEKELETT